MKIMDLMLPARDSIRPRPLFKLLHTNQVAVILTCWGDTSQIDNMLKLIEKSLIENNQNQESNEQFDPDVTKMNLKTIESAPPKKRSLEVVFQKILRELNKYIALEVNKKEWVTCIEITLVGKDRQNLFWSHAGQPQIFRATETGLEPLSYTADPSSDFNQSSPLPVNCLGLELDLQIQSGYIPLDKIKNIVLFSCPKVPAELYSSRTTDLDSLAQLIQEHYPNSPVWSGLIDITTS